MRTAENLVKSLKSKPFCKKFLREYFCIPKQVKLDWAVIHVTTNSEDTCRLVLQLNNSDLYLDVQQGQFFTAIDEIWMGTRRRLHKVTSKAVDGDYYVFYSEQKSLKLRKDWLSLVYEHKIFQSEMKDTILC